jgi:hypothetical protein
MELRSNMAMKFFALILFIGELLAPSLMATFEVPTSNGRASVSIQASGNHIPTIFSETDNEERNQDDKHVSATPLFFEHTFLSVRPLNESLNFCKPVVRHTPLQKSLFAMHSLLLI